MEWKKSDLLQAIDHGDEKIRNYFDTFGVVVIRGMLNRGEFSMLMKEYDCQYDQRANKATPHEMLKNRLGFSGPIRYGFRHVARGILKRDAMRFLPNFVDSSKIFSEFFFRDEMQKIYRYFAGDQFLYLGSDGSHFITTSFPWHRDWYTKMPIMKFNYYFNKYPFIGGKFKVIPGTNFPNDTYSKLLQKSMAWPIQNKLPGGLAENEFLPQITNPRISPQKAALLKMSQWLGRGRKMPEVPHLSIKLRRGDIVIFDQRLIHCVQSNFPAFSRRLLTMLLAKNAYDFPADHYLFEQGHRREELMKEVVDLVVSERNHINCPRYGEAIEAHPFAQGPHFIAIDKQVTNTVADESKYNIGSFTLKNDDTFTSILDVEKYAQIGSEFRQLTGQQTKDMGDKLSEQYSYGDVHLGINAQNIRPVKSA